MNKDVMDVQEVSPGYEFVAENPAVPVGYKQTEVGVIPEDWDAVRIDQHAVIKTGGKNTQDKIEDGLFPFFVRSQQVERINSYSYDGEAVLTAGDGVGTGKVFHYINGKFDVHQRVYRISEFTSELDGRYFFYQFSSHFYDRIMSLTAKSSVDSVRMEMIAGMQIALPPQAEQQAIATALSDVDALQEELDRLIAKKRDIKQAAMQQLLTGETRLPGFDGEWDAVKFSALATLSNARIDPGRSEGSDFCIELEHINQGTGLLNGSTVTTETSSLKTTFEPGDVLFGKLRAYLRKYWIASRSGVCSTEIWVLKANSQLVLPQYLFQIVTTDSFIESASTAYGTHMPRSDWKVVREAQWSIPCINEQQAIAAVLSDMDTEIQALEQRRSKTAELKQGMMQELLTGRTRLI
jgi:type I restriction enzyme S subunit